MGGVWSGTGKADRSSTCADVPFLRDGGLWSSLNYEPMAFKLLYVYDLIQVSYH